MPSNNQKPKGYDKENHLTFLHSLVGDAKKEWPDENVHVDEEDAEVVWGLKQNIQEKKDDTIKGYFDKLRKDYTWL